MKRLKKLAVLCAGCLAFAGIAPVFPAETAVYAEETPTSGTCGENLTWNFDEATGTLTIEGSGEMNHSVMDEGFLYTSWQGVEQQQIKKVELPDGLTSIGNYAFFSCYNLTSIIIPESVISIGKYAFFRCTRLTDITMSPNITSIGDNALSDTPWFDALSAESDLFIVNHEVIRGGGQGEIRIPDGVTSIGKNAFSNCTELTDIILPDTLEKIEPYAFYGCKGLVDITIPKNVKMIGKEAFLTCDSLKNLTLLSEETILNRTAFQKNDYLTVTGYTGSFNKQGYLTKYGGFCGADITWCYDEDTKKLIVDGTGAMDSYELLFYPSENGDHYESTSPFPASVREAEFRSGVTEIGYNAFYNCMSLKSITIPETVTTITTVIAFREERVWDEDEIEWNYERYENRPSIKGYTGSYAEEYAKAKNLKFEALDAEPLWGDVNCDSSVDVSDAVLICRFAVADAEVKITDQGKKQADVTHDSTVDAKDSEKLVQYIAKKLTADDLKA